MSKAMRVAALAAGGGVSMTVLVAGLPHLSFWLVGAEWGAGMRVFVAAAAALLGLWGAVVSVIWFGESP